MSRGGEAPWAPDEALRFFDAYHLHPQDWEQVSAAVGGERTPGACEALYRRQQAYLGIPREFQSAQAFSALVENAQREEPAAEPGSQGGSGAGPDGAASGGSRPRLKREEGVGEEVGEPGEVGTEDEEEEGSRRSRRTPKRGASPAARAAGRRTPVSGAKRSRGGGGGHGDIYEYYDEGQGATESARKRRAARQRLDFVQGSRRRHDADEAKGIDALLALAVAGEESALALGSEEEEEADVPAPRPRKPPASRARRRSLADDQAWEEEEEEEEEEEPEDAGAVDDDEEDEDFAPPPRRTPYSTPAKGARLPRPGSAHATPRRSGSRGVAGGGLSVASPGLGLPVGLSPYLLGGLDSGGDMMELGLADLGYITSPGFPQFAAGFVPSPQNPMPRLRRRKSAPERLAPATASPVKTLFTRRSSLASGTALLGGFSLGGQAAPGAGAAAPPQSAGEARLRHCLQQPRTQRWAAAEFCYSALDRPFFMFNPLAGLLAALGLADGARLTRREWSLIRAGLGKPRRLSLKFLKEERARLERWREGCRQQYASGAAAVADPKVADHLPWPLAVGQRVVARHPATHQLHDGSVLTVAHNCYRVQFDRQELGVELVRDTDLQPADPADNLPPALLAARTHLVLNGRQLIHGQPVRPSGGPRRGPAPAASAAAAAPPAAATPLAAAAGGERGAPGSGGVLPATSADAQALAELAVGLDKKEALLSQLRGMNDEAAAGVHGTAGRPHPAPFVNAYANVVLQLKQVNDKVQGRLEELEGPGGDAAGEAAASGVSAGALPSSAPALPQAPEALAAAALEQARSIIASCRGKLAESAAAEAEGTQQGSDAAAGGGEAVPPADAASQAVAADADASHRAARGQQGGGDARQLGSLVEGCVQSLVLLLQGAQAGAGLPPASLSAALDAALAAVQPAGAANRQLYQQVQEAVAGLKLQISAAS